MKSMIKGFWQKRLVDQVKVTCLLAVLLSGIGLAIQWYAVSRIGYGGVFLIQMEVWLALPLHLAVLAVPLSFFALPFRRVRRHATTTIVCGTLYVIIGLPALRLSWPIRRGAFDRLAEHSAPLVAAIQRFEKANDRPPKSLEELVPKYLARAPATDMPAYPRYRYSGGDQTNRWEGNPWVLYVNTSSGGINFDMFMYFPKQNYPKRGYGGSLERIRDWAYVHE
ncbi:MAG: hypothetical protein PHR35_07670 [Kiritimatiellae bacterium]|nr:hypothetical protein [Kiritimatiellia bacterium]